MNKYLYLLISVFVVIILLHVWGAVSPMHENWGFHFFGFYGETILFLFAGILVVAAIPKFQNRILKFFEIGIRKLSALPLPVAFILTAAVFYALIYLFPAKLHLLGDGAVLLRSVSLGISGDEITLSFRNQPLMFWIYRTAMAIHPTNAAPNSYTVYLLIDLAAAFIFLMILFWVFRRIHIPLIEKILLACLLVFSAGTQFYFGYVENYILLYTVTIGYVLTAWLCLDQKASIVVPILFYVLMVLLHMGTLAFIPSLILLIILKWKRNKLHAAAFIGATGVIGVIVLYIMGFDLAYLTRHLGSGSVDFLKLFEGGRGVFPYAMFSWAHLLDWFNAHMLLAPLGILVSAVLIMVIPKERRWRNPILLFMVTAALCGMFFTWIINSALGMARDWDLFLSFFVPLAILPIYLLSQVSSLPGKRSILFIIVVFMLLRTAAWIGINASEERHLNRMRTLNSELLLSRAANMVYDESLANLFFDTERYKDARIYYEHYMTIDSMNPRIIGNIADVYRRIGEKDKYFYQLLRAVAVNSPDAGVYSNIGVEFAARGDTAKAIEFNLLAVKKNPTMHKAYANLGILYSSRQDFRSADKYFSAAINLGMRDQLLFRYAAEVCVMIQDYQRALKYYDTYLSMNPSDKQSRDVRNRIYQGLKQLKK